MYRDKFLVKGLAGERLLRGEIRVSGAKNEALKLMAASVLFEDGVKLKNVPEIEDVHRMTDILSGMGVEVLHPKEHHYEFAVPKKCDTALPSDVSKHIRASVVLTGPILARYGRVRFPHPGGCVIGKRPIDLFIEGFVKMGASVRIRGGYYVIEAPKGRLNGAELFLRTPSVTATETFMMAATLAHGVTIIKNAAMEPEIVSLAKFLSSSGAKITGAGTPTITIVGGKVLRRNGESCRVIPDRIEAGSFVLLAALAAEDVTISHCNPGHLDALIELLECAGVKMDIGKHFIRIVSPQKKSFAAVDVKTHEYPGFPTDLQAPMTVFLTQAKGESMVFETIFEGRLNYTESLAAMGADIKIMDPHRALVKGPQRLHGKVLESPDLRAGLAFVIAAAIASGSSVVHNVYNIDRGYERVEKRLGGIGVDIIRVREDGL